MYSEPRAEVKSASSLQFSEPVSLWHFCAAEIASVAFEGLHYQAVILIKLIFLNDLLWCAFDCLLKIGLQIVVPPLTNCWSVPSNWLSHFPVASPQDSSVFNTSMVVPSCYLETAASVRCQGIKVFVKSISLIGS